MKLKALVVTFLFAAGVAASVAVAKGPPPGKGKNKGDDAAAVSTGTTTTSDRGKGKDKKKKSDRQAAVCKPTVTFDLKGEFVSAAATSTVTGADATGPAVLGTFDMKVTSANKHGRQYVGKTATISYDRKTSFRRRGHADLEDFEPGDRLNVKVRACKPAKTSGDDDDEDGTATDSTSTTPTTGVTAAQELLLAKKVDGKPAKTSTTTTTTTTTTSP